VTGWVLFFTSPVNKREDRFWGGEKGPKKAKQKKKIGTTAGFVPPKITDTAWGRAVFFWSGKKLNRLSICCKSTQGKIKHDGTKKTSGETPNEFLNLKAAGGKRWKCGSNILFF